MSDSPVLNIVHEAETQRQHVRIRLPLQVEIDGHSYPAADWSKAGLALKLDSNTRTADLRRGHTYAAVLHYPFDGFALSMPVDLEVTQRDETANRAGCRFLHLTPQQQSIIQHLVSAYVSGELVRADEIIHIAGRDNFTRARSTANIHSGLSKADKNRRKIRIGMIGLFALLMVGYISLSLYQRLFIITAVSGKVVAENVIIDLPNSGRVHYAKLPANSEIRRGEPLLTVTRSDNSIVSIDSPCDCIVKQKLLADGRKAAKGEAALALVATDSVPLVEGYINHTDVTQLAVGQEALIALPGQEARQRGEIIDIRAAEGIDGKPMITVKPDRDLPARFIDDPAEIRIDLLNWL